MTSFSIVGKRLPRVDALAKVTGTAAFSADITLPGMLHGKILRSPFPHAKIRRLDTTAARSQDGVWPERLVEMIGTQLDPRVIA